MDWLIPDGQWSEHLFVTVVAFAATALALLVHYEGIRWIGRRFSGRELHRHRGAMLRIMFALLGLHIIEIWCYALAYWGLVTQFPGAGFVHGEHAQDTLFDVVYLSATVYSTVGFGDLAPVGPIRIIAGMESLTGLLLIAWSASFTFLEMSRLWRDGRTH